MGHTLERAAKGAVAFTTLRQRPFVPTLADAWGAVASAMCAAVVTGAAR